MRKEINELVRSYALRNGGCYRESWNRLYRDFNKQNHSYIKAVATHKKKSSVIELVEEFGKLDNLLAIAKTLFIA